MDYQALQTLIQQGESSTVQFKERVKDASDIAAEMVAMTNGKGGMILVGINDKTGALSGLSFQELQATNQLLVNAATNNVKSPINIFTQTITVNDQNIIAVTIDEGLAKPYRDNKGVIWVKNGSDKRRVVTNEELMRLLQSGGNIYADEEVLKNTSIQDVDLDVFRVFIKKKTGSEPEELDLSLSQLLQNMSFAEGDNLTLAGLLMFGKNPQLIKPIFTVQCVSFLGNDISAMEYRDSEPPFEGNLSVLFSKTMSFLLRNLKKLQNGQSFNSVGVLEVARESLEEIVVNALIHRDYFISSSVKVFIFDDRIEIISPGKLPNSLTVEKIKAGISIVRNPVLFSNARFILPYIGIGSCIPRAFKFYPGIDLYDLEDKEQFVAVIHRP